MINKIILETSAAISYSQNQISDISTTSNNLRDIVKNQSDFNESFLGGSYKRNTMVKNISDVDLYFQYTGVGNPQSALDRLKSCLIKTYPSTPIKQDKPSIFVDFNKIPFNITPYRKDIYGISIPDAYLLNWQRINFGELEAAITSLRTKNPKFIDLIKVLKLWNRNYNRGLKNFDIEKRVISNFINSYTQENISGWMWTFFQQNGFQRDGQRLNGLLINNTLNEAALKTEWLKFIENK
jgi:hypothetical protein